MASNNSEIHVTVEEAGSAGFMNPGVNNMGRQYTTIRTTLEYFTFNLYNWLQQYGGKLKHVAHNNSTWHTINVVINPDLSINITTTVDGSNITIKFDKKSGDNDKYRDLYTSLYKALHTYNGYGYFRGARRHKTPRKNKSHRSKSRRSKSCHSRK